MVDHRHPSDDGQRRHRIRSLLEGGLNTEMMPRADSHERVMEIVRRLRLNAGDLAEKLKISGFTLHPVEHEGMIQACETCMYYKSHAKYCELPELDLPVEAEWSCRLWRI